jgi:ribosomal protein L6P/L9E
MFIFGNTSYNSLTQVTSQIRSCKVPEIYKGKGILYYQEKVILKKGKKV